MSTDRNLSSNEDNKSNYENIRISVDEDKRNNLAEEGPKCFVCDAKIRGRHYSLATCKTQSSRAKVVEKLGELVGERYMVVISEDDVICRSCASLINTLDKLEAEIFSVRMNVLRFLEQKYSLQEGEFLENSKNTKRWQPPQITKSTNQDCQIKKRSSASVSSLLEKNTSKKRNLWMQCNKCHYTTSYNSFGAHHRKSRDIHSCDTEKQRKTSLNTCSENVVHASLVQSKSEEENVPLMSVQTFTDARMSYADENIPAMKADSDRLHIPNILPSEHRSGTDEPLYVRVLQPLEIGEDSIIDPAMLTASTSNPGMVIKVKDSDAKQILTVTEHGNLEMMEVTWNDVQSFEDDPKLTFQ